MANIAGNGTGNESKQYINYLSGATGVFPYVVASGKSSPDTGAPRLATGKTTPILSSTAGRTSRAPLALSGCAPSPSKARTT